MLTDEEYSLNLTRISGWFMVTVEPSTECVLHVKVSQLKSRTNSPQDFPETQTPTPSSSSLLSLQVLEGP